MASNDLRYLVLNMLIRTFEKGELSHIVLREIYEDSSMSPRDLSFVNRLYSGTLEKVVYLDYLIEAYSQIPLRKMKPVIRNILRMSLYQMRFMDSVPVSAAINEGVKLTRKKGLSGLTGFVNGVLRRADREADQLPLVPWVELSAPQWLYQMMTEQYGQEAAEAFFQKIQQTEEGIRIRLCLNEEKPEEILQSLKKEGCHLEPIEGVDFGYCLSGFQRLTSLKAFRKGQILIQDPSSLFAAQTALRLKPNADLVVDVCAAPGGKCLYIAEKCPEAKVIARDLSESKVNKILENAARIGIRNLEVQIRDARIVDPDLNAMADLVICDLPCSGLGVISRKPDILYRLKPEDLLSLSSLQREILQAAQAMVKPGGILLYSTCTVNREENEENTKWFLKSFDFQLEYEKQFLPGRDPYDGFYIAGFCRDSFPHS